MKTSLLGRRSCTLMFDHLFPKPSCFFPPWASRASLFIFVDSKAAPDELGLSSSCTAPVSKPLNHEPMACITGPPPSPRASGKNGDSLCPRASAHNSEGALQQSLQALLVIRSEMWIDWSKCNASSILSWRRRT